MTAAPGTGSTLSLAVITHTDSGRNRRQPRRIDDLLRSYPDVRHFPVADRQTLNEALAEIRQHPPEVLAINAGDGAVALTLGALLDDPPRPFPTLALIAGGTTNMSAADLGVRGRPVPALRRLIRHCRDPGDATLVERSLLRLRADDRPPHCGFFLGTGLISRAVALSRWRRARARRPALVPPLLTLSLLGALLRGDRRLAAPQTLALGIDGADPEPFPVQALFATTLHRLLLGIAPFPEPPAAGRLHWGATRPGAKSPWRTLPAFLRGRSGAGATPDNGYHRGSAGQLTLLFHGRYMVDGEIYPVTSRLDVTTTGYLRFLRV